MKFEQGGLQAKYFSAKIVTGLQPMGSGEARFAFTIRWGGWGRQEHFCLLLQPQNDLYYNKN